MKNYTRNHTLTLANGSTMTVKGKTSKIIESCTKFNKEEDFLMFTKVSCPVKDNNEEYLYSFIFSLDVHPMYTAMTRSRDTKHAVNVGNTVWDSPYHIPMEVL